MQATMGIAASPEIGAELARVADQVKRSTVQLGVRGRGVGAGVIWRREGIIVTNAHVCSEGRARVSLTEGATLDAEVTACDPRSDLALLRAEAADLPAATIGAADALRVGELVLAIGSPLGVTNALAAGIVHAIGGRWIRADIRLFPGNSGGPLANARGEVIGVNSMIAGGLGLAVPAGTVERFLRGESRPRLGVRLQPVVVAAGGVRAAGLMIVVVEPGSRAESVELVTGDVILGVDGQLFSSPADLLGRIGELDPLLATVLEIVRAGRRLAVEMPPFLDGRREAA
jgi:serine protease Do